MKVRSAGEIIDRVLRVEEEARAIRELESADPRVAGLTRVQRRLLGPYMRSVSAFAFGIAAGVSSVIICYCVTVLVLHFQP